MTLVQTWLCSSAASWRGVEIFTAPWAVPHTDSPVTGVRAQRQGNTAASPQHGLILTAGWGRQHGWWLAIGGSCRIPLPPRYLWMGPCSSTVWPKSSTGSLVILSSWSCWDGWRVTAWKPCTGNHHRTHWCKVPFSSRWWTEMSFFSFFLLKCFSGRVDFQRQCNKLHVSSKL